MQCGLERVGPGLRLSTRMPPFKMVDSEIDEWSSFDSTPTDSFATTCYESTFCGRSEPGPTLSSGGEGFGSTASQEIARCFPAPPAVSFDNYSEPCLDKSSRLLQSTQTIKNLCRTFRDPLRWRDSRTESLFLGALGLCPAKENKKPCSSWEHVDIAVLDEGEQMFSYHNLSRRNNYSRNTATGEGSRTWKDLQAARPSEVTTGSHVNQEGSVTANDEHCPEMSSLNFDGHQAAVGLSHHSIDELILLREEMSVYVQEYSDILVDELTHREEQLREKAVKNKFISTLLAIQSRISLQQNKAKKSNLINGKYLTTVIPYTEEMGGLSTNILRDLIEMMEAMLAESPIVPNLLTDYILKVLCAEDD